MVSTPGRDAIVGHPDKGGFVDMVAHSGLSRPSTREPSLRPCTRIHLDEGSSFDGRVTLLEAAYITLVLHTGRETTAQSRPAENVERPRARICRGTACFPESWAMLDDWFALRVPTLRSCPHFLRGRLRHCSLREQRRAKIEGDEAAEVRAWKLFGLVP